MLNATHAETPYDPTMGAALLGRVVLAELRRMGAVPPAARELAASAWEAAIATRHGRGFTREKHTSKPTEMVDQLVSDSLRRLNEAIQFDDLDAVLVRHAKAVLPKAVAAAMMHVVRR